MLSALPFYYLFIIISATAFASTTRKMKAEFQDFTDQMLPCKGRRSKRPRASPPVGVAIDSSPSEDGDGTKHPCVSRPVGVAVNSSPSGDGGGGCDGCYSSLVHSPTSSCSQMSMAIQEDENMAHCLILLARSGCPKQDAGNDVTVERISCRKSSHTAAAATANPAATTTTTTSVYECKTCNRKFPSFQALGGHRASHSKPKLIPEDHKKSTPFDHHHHYHDQDNTHEKSNKTKIHECSICGSLFYSGQALGGHMRRHRPLHINTTTTTMKASMDNDDDQEKPKPVFTLDLNLPAPDDDEADEENTAMFEFSDKQQSSAFSTSAMVDCHY